MEEVLSDIPFIDKETGKVVCPAKPVGGAIFVWPIRPKDRIGSIIIPDLYKNCFKTGLGLILSVGPGYYNKAEKWCPVTLKPGQVVMYDPTVPYAVEIECSLDGKKYKVKRMGQEDIRFTVGDEDGIEVKEIGKWILRGVDDDD